MRCFGWGGWVAGVWVLALGFQGCGTPFPSRPTTVVQGDGLAADTIFQRCLSTHGGDLRESAGDLNLSITGTWDTLIQKIQPLISDAAYRVTSQERTRAGGALYTVRYEGPAGVKKVVRTPDAVEVFYNGVRERDPARLQATALTADAYQLFHFSPSFLVWRGATFVRLADTTEDGVRYHRLLATVRPGFGFSAEDQVVLWIETGTFRLFRVHLTLEGFESTRGAHVDTTFLEYRQVGRFLMPVRFHERVRGPLRISAHRWHLTGIDLGRGWSDADVSGPDFGGRAAAPATPLVPPVETAR
ncbi:MAG: hypothetical protein U1F61_28330 [Opitutaceae bacterium]